MCLESEVRSRLKTMQCLKIAMYTKPQHRAEKKKEKEKTVARANEDTMLALQPSPEPSPCIAVLAVLDTSYHKTLSSFRFQPWRAMDQQVTYFSGWVTLQEEWDA